MSSQIRKMQTKSNKKTAASVAAPVAKKAAPAPSDVVGNISTELRVRMKNLSDAANGKRAEIATLALQRTEMRIRISQIEAEEADRLRSIVEMNAELEKCRAEINASIHFEENVNYHVDLNTGEVKIMPPEPQR